MITIIHILQLYINLFLKKTPYNAVCRQWKEFEETKGVIIIRKSKNRKHNGQKK